MRRPCLPRQPRIVNFHRPFAERRPDAGGGFLEQGHWHASRGLDEVGVEDVRRDWRAGGGHGSSGGGKSEVLLERRKSVGH